MSQNCIYFLVIMMIVSILSMILNIWTHIRLWSELKKVYGDKLINLLGIHTLKHFNSIDHVYGLTIKSSIRLKIMLFKKDIRLKKISKNKGKMVLMSSLFFYIAILSTVVAMFLCATKSN